MNIACPECGTIYRVDPERIPEGGVTTRCRECDTEFRVTLALAPTAPGEHAVAPRVQAAGTDVAAGEQEGPTGEAEAAAPDAEAPDRPTRDDGAGESAAATAPSSGEAPVFGPQDPNTRARRLARALVSDIKVYHPDRWEESAREGTLRTDFRDEIMKSWEEYVEQVGEEMAKKTPYFRDALNEILAQGDRVF